MEIYKVIRNQMKDKGVSQTWVVNATNALDATLNLTNNKLSTMLLGKRKIAGEEFIALCRVLDLDTKNFTRPNDKDAS